MSSISITRYEALYKQEVKNFLISILEGEFGHYNVERPDLGNIAAYYQTDLGNFWVAIKDNKIIGTIGLKDYKDGIGYLQRMSVSKEFRGTGLAQALLKTLIEFAQKNKYKAIYLATSPNMVAANKFYAKEGFRKITKLPK